MLGTESEAASQIARTLYGDAPIRVRLQQRFRPYICSFDPLVPEIRSRGGRLLDFGCGAGLFSFHCVARGYVFSADGVDVDPFIIRTANAARTSFAQAPQLRFHVRDVPTSTYDSIAMIDVMHHLSPEIQQPTLTDLCEYLTPGGVLLYKDMALRPRWRATANRLHDLILNKQRIHYAPIEAVIAWATEGANLELVRQARFEQIVYGHELAVFRKPDGAATSPSG